MIKGASGAVDGAVALIWIAPCRTESPLHFAFRSCGEFGERLEVSGRGERPVRVRLWPRRMFCISAWPRMITHSEGSERDAAALRA